MCAFSFRVHFRCCRLDDGPVNFSPGRVVRVCTASGKDLHWGIIHELTRTNALYKGPEPSWAAPKASKYVVSVVIRDVDRSGMRTVDVPLFLVTALSAIKVNLPQVAQIDDLMFDLQRSLKQIEKRYGESLPVLDPVKDMHVDAEEYAPLDERLSALKKRIKSLRKKVKEEAQQSPTAMDVDVPPSAAIPSSSLVADSKSAATASSAQQLVEMYASGLEELKAKMRESHLSLFKGELHARSQVLRKLGHIDEHDVVQLKGRAACQIDTADELMAAELMFDGTFSRLDYHSIAALASCLIPAEKSNDDVTLKGTLRRSLESLQAAATRIAELSKECGLDVDPEEYVESFGASMMDVVYGWSKGADFGTVTQETDLFEGSIVRAMRRLDELLQQLGRAAEAVGDKTLETKFTKASESIRRGIIFCNSLYLAE